METFNQLENKITQPHLYASQKTTFLQHFASPHTVLLTMLFLSLYLKTLQGLFPEPKREVKCR